ncbi:MAG: hypothetical protein M3464_17020 [Chloroflexota bacterium]|nr:hypothetical protein [Chloroflexota bacterium]
MQRIFDVILRRERDEPLIPHCPDHQVEMVLRGKQGRPTRFSDQSEEEYTLIYYCPVEGCNQTATLQRLNTQIPVPGESPRRPDFARRNY